MAYTGDGEDWTPRHLLPSGDDLPPPDYDSPDPLERPSYYRDLNEHGVHPAGDPYAAAAVAQEQHNPSFYDHQHSRQGSGDFDNAGFQSGETPPVRSPGPLSYHPSFHHPPPHHQRTRSEGGPLTAFDDLDGLERQQRGVDNDLRQGLRHRYSPRRQKSRRSRRRHGEESYDDDMVRTMRREDLQRARDFLATIRVRCPRQRKSLKRLGSSQRSEGEGSGSESGDAQGEAAEEEDEDYEEVTGMPSAHVLGKSKTLGQRLKELRGTNEEVARSLRETYADFDPSLVASAAWKGWEKKKAQLSDVWAHLDIWSSHFKEIEGRFGNATASYFRFTRWLLFLNVYTFLVSFLVVVVPFFATSEPTNFLPGVDLANPQPIDNGSKFANVAINCSATYTTSIENFTNHEAIQDQVLDFFVGTGWMEQTSMFYGHYHNRTFPGDYSYNMGLAYIMAIGVTFLISFILILINSSSSVKETVMDQEQSSVHFTNIVMCGWDYCILDDKSAQNKKSILYQEFKADLLEQNKRLQRENRTYRQKVKLVFVRIAINFVVVCILGGCIFLIYFATNNLLDLREKTTDQVLLLIIQLLPSITITLINFIIPEFFNIMVSLEDYWPAFELKITLMRTVFLRLSSLGVLTFTLYYTLLWPNDKGDFKCEEEDKTDNKCCGNYLWEGQKKLVNGTVVESENRGLSTVQCWETYVGQQFYKLALVDFAALILITFLVEFPRKFVFEHFKDKLHLLQKYGQQEFDIPRNVLDIVYSQTLSWLGMFYSPLLPAMTLLKVFFIFYIKKLTLMKNFAPPQNVYKVSRSNSFFNLILLISFIIVAAIIGYVLGNIQPSMSCGPYRLYSTEDYVTWTALTDVIAGWPNWASTVFFFFGTTAFFVPCFILLCLLMYYYWAVGVGYKRRDEILKEQLKLEGKDKHYLLARVNDIIKQGNLQGVTSGRS